MAISIVKENGSAKIDLNNGHLSALEKIVKDYKLAGDKEALDFILSIVSQADGGAINNGKGSFLPSEKLKAQLPHNG